MQLVCDLIAVAGAIWFAHLLAALWNEIRTIYAQKGIVPVIASVLQDATELYVPPEA